VAAGTPAKKVGSSLARNGPSGKLGIGKHTRSRKRGPVEREYVAVDLHRLRSLIVREVVHNERHVGDAARITLAQRDVNR
jgi:hypothetical protein